MASWAPHERGQRRADALPHRGSPANDCASTTCATNACARPASIGTTSVGKACDIAASIRTASVGPVRARTPCGNTT